MPAEVEFHYAQCVNVQPEKAFPYYEVRPTDGREDANCIVLQVFGQPFITHLPDFDHVARMLLQRNRVIEPVQSMLLASIVQPSDVVVDVGAHTGYYSFLMRKLVGERGCVHAYEPEKDNISFFQVNMRLRDKEPNVGQVELHPMAAFNFDGSQDFIRNQLQKCLHSFYPREDQPSNDIVRVDTVRLDRSLYTRNDKPGKKISLIKIDAEGAEFEVLQGAERIIGEHKPKLIIEWEVRDRMAALRTLAFLDHMGYRNIRWFQAEGSVAVGIHQLTEHWTVEKLRTAIDQLQISQGTLYAYH